MSDQLMAMDLSSCESGASNISCFQTCPIISNSLAGAWPSLLNLLFQKLSQYFVKSRTWQEIFWNMLPERMQSPTLQVGDWHIYVDSFSAALKEARSAAEISDVVDNLQNLDLLAVIDGHYDLFEQAIESKLGDEAVIKALGHQAISELTQTEQALALAIDHSCPEKAAIWKKCRELFLAIRKKKREYRKLIARLPNEKAEITPVDIATLDLELTQLAPKTTWLKWFLGSDPLKLPETAKKVLGVSMLAWMLPPFTATAARGELPQQSLAVSEPVSVSPSIASALAVEIPMITWPEEMQNQQKSDLLALIPNAAHVEPTGSKKGINAHYRVTTREGLQYFFKTFIDCENRQLKLSQNLLSKHEASVSQLANYLTSGLVPEGRAIGNGIAYPYQEIDWGMTQAVFPHAPSYATLSLTQKVDLFMNLIVDIALLNDDVHPNQFGVGQNGHLISFDKGRAYWEVFQNKEDFSQDLRLPEDLGLPEERRQKIYQEFILALKDHPKDLQDIIEDPRVQTTLMRLDCLNRRDQRLLVKELLNPMFTTLFEHFPKRQFLEVYDNYFIRLQKIPLFLAEELGIDVAALIKPSNPLTIQHGEEDTTFITFDPRQYGLQLIAPLSEGFATGARVSEMVQRANAILGMNAGFFTQGTGVRWSMGWLLSKAKQHAGLTTEAFPSAILYVNGQLLSDTPDYLPAIGWNKAGTHFEVGNVKVTWQAKLPDLDAPFPIRRVTPIDPQDPTAIFYYDVGVNTKAFTVQNGILQQRTEVERVDEGKSNGFVFIDPSPEMIVALENLQEGQTFHHDARFEAQIPQQTERFQDLDYVVSGGAILIDHGQMNIDCALNVRPEAALRRTAICIGADGKISLVAAFEAQTLTDFVKVIQQKLPDTIQAISLDGGGSTTLSLPDGNSWETRGLNPVVSDAVLVTELNGLAHKLRSQDSPIFDALMRGNINQLKALLIQDPSRIHAKNHNQQGLLQVHLKQSSDGKLDPNMIAFLLDRMTAEDCERADIFGETVVHTALRYGQTPLAFQLLDKVADDSPIWLQQGIQNQRIDDIEPSLVLAGGYRTNRWIRNLQNNEDSLSIIDTLQQLNNKGLLHTVSSEVLIDVFARLSMQLLTNQDKNVATLVVGIARALIERGHGMEDVMELFHELSTSQDSYVLGLALNLAKTLVRKGHGIEDVIEVFKRLSTSQDLDVLVSVSELAKTLVEKGHGIEDVIEVFKRLSTSQHFYVLGLALDLAKILVEKGIGIEDVIEVLQRLSTSQDLDVLVSVSELAKTLVEKGVGIEDVSEVLKRLSMSQDRDVLVLASQLAQTLIEKGVGIEDAIEAIKRLYTSQDRDVLRRASSLVYTLIGKGHVWKM